MSGPEENFTPLDGEDSGHGVYSDLDGHDWASKLAKPIVEGNERGISLDRDTIEMLSGQPMPEPAPDPDAFDEADALSNDAETAYEAAAPSSRFTQMGTADFEALIAQVKEGSELEAPGTATDHEWFEGVADVWPRETDRTQY
jgi:hypothetical protein